MGAAAGFEDGLEKRYRLFDVCFIVQDGVIIVGQGLTLKNYRMTAIGIDSRPGFAAYLIGLIKVGESSFGIVSHGEGKQSPPSVAVGSLVGALGEPNALVQVVLGSPVIEQESVDIAYLAMRPTEEIRVFVPMGKLKGELREGERATRVVRSGAGTVVQLPDYHHWPALGFCNLTATFNIGPLILKKGLAGSPSTIVG